jgi:hypothetical protein
MIRNIFIIICALLFISCEEEPPYINYEKPNSTIDTTWVKPTPSAPQQRQVLIEDFTGVKCINCPDATLVAKNLIATYPNRVNVAAIHMLGLLNNFTSPINQDGYKSKYDFRTQQGADIALNVLGVPNNLPKGAIDRTKFPDRTDIYVDYTSWTAKVGEQIGKTTPVNITLENVATTGNEVTVDVTIEYTEAVNDTNYLTLMIVEDGIVDVQEYIDRTDPQNPVASYNENYVHNHVMRAIVTATTGDILNRPNVSLVAGRIFKRRYTYSLEGKNWVKSNLHVIGFVHRNGASKEVLQSNQVKVE